MTAPKPIASLSLDLDNLWSYMKASGIAGWQGHPSYLDRLTPRIIDVLAAHGLKATIFIVGRDAAEPANAAHLKALALAGHELGNHSFAHDPAIGRAPIESVRAEIAAAEEAIAAATGHRPLGFRGPSFALSTSVLDVLLERGYLYDASTFPTFIGPLARRYHFKTSTLSEAERAERALVFGTFKDGLRPNAPYLWRLAKGDLLEIPVTTVPGIRTPVHLTYLTFLAQSSESAAIAYLRTALALCRATKTEPSLLLHPLDFIGGDELPVLASFPGMRLATKQKLAFLDRVLESFAESFQVVTMREHARLARLQRSLASRRPSFEADTALLAPISG